MEQKKYIVNAKVNGDGHFCRWHVNNLMKFEAFLDQKYPDWRWYNVHFKDKNAKNGLGEQIASFTKHRRANVIKPEKI